MLRNFQTKAPRLEILNDVCLFNEAPVPGINRTFVQTLVQTLSERPHNADSEANPTLVQAAALFKENFKHSKLRVSNLVETHIDSVPRERRFPIVNCLRVQGTFADLEMLVTNRSALEERIVLVDLIGLKKRNAACLAKDSTSRKKKMSAEMKITCLEYPGNVNQEGNTLGGSKLKSSAF